MTVRPTPRRAAILGTGRAAPGPWVESATLDRAHGWPEGHVERVTGVARRHFADGADQVDLAAQAAHTALGDAGLEPSSLDAILHAAAVPYQPIPATAPLIQRALGLPDGASAAYDVNATCLGFLAALQHAQAMVEAGRWRHVLIASAEIASRGLDWTEPTTAGLFADGAGAAVVGPGGGLTLRDVALETHPSGWEASQLAAGGTRHAAGTEAFEAGRRFHMDGPALFALTRRRFAPFVHATLAQSGWTMDEVDLVVPHQASPLALRAMARALSVPPDRLVDVAAEGGNAVAASLPMTLDRARRAGRVVPGAKLLMLGTAAGVTFGAATLEAPCG